MVRIARYTHSCTYNPSVTWPALLEELLTGLQLQIWPGYDYTGTSGGDQMNPRAGAIYYIYPGRAQQGTYGSGLVVTTLDLQVGANLRTGSSSATRLGLVSLVGSRPALWNHIPLLDNATEEANPLLKNLRT